jgi:hypothetical protein
VRQRISCEPFGCFLFNGDFATEKSPVFSPEYAIAIGDKISIKIWGSIDFEQVQVVDAQGNIFLPRVGPVKVVRFPVVRQRHLESELSAPSAACARCYAQRKSCSWMIDRSLETAEAERLARRAGELDVQRLFPSRSSRLSVITLTPDSLPKRSGPTASLAREGTTGTGGGA